MNLDKYTSLTGITVDSSDEAKVKAMIARTKSMLETALGYTLKPKYLYTEKGKVQFEGYLPLPIEDQTNNLLPPDEEQGLTKLFDYKESDRFLHVDPYKNVYSVKLVYPVTDGEFITIVKLDNVVAHYERDGIGKFVEKHYDWFTWEWYRTWRLSWDSRGSSGVQLAVDADWIDCYPDDLMYLWADMVTYYADPDSNIKSESVTGHSWTKADTTPPQDLPSNQKLLARYAGPRGAVVHNPVGGR